MVAVATMPRHNWSAEIRERAMTLYAEGGAAHAARETGVPVGTVKSWASRGDACEPRQEQLAAALEARSTKWAERRSRMIDDMGRIAEKALGKSEAAMDRDDARPAVNFATAMAILVDKAQLLSGDATSRHDVADPRRRLAAMRDELAERRGRGAA